jgi:hypothetical protein
MIDLQGIEDEQERAKAMKRQLEEDQKKALRVKEVEERGDKKKRKKVQKSVKKSSRKGKRKMNPPENQKVRVSLLQVPHMNPVLMLQHFLEEQNAIPPTSS